MKAAFWLLVCIAVAGLVAFTVHLRQQWAARKRAEEARAMQLIAEVMRATSPGKGGSAAGSGPDLEQSYVQTMPARVQDTTGPDSESPPDQKQP